MSEPVIRKPIIEKNRIVRLRAYARNRPKSNTPSSDDLLSLHESIKSHSNTHLPLKNSPEYLNQLIKSLLYPNIECTNYRDILPNLTSSDLVDLQLYPLLGLLLKNFVNSWYTRITDDTDFVNELLGIISHITRNLETRLKTVNLLELLLDDIPLILDEQLKSYRRILNELGSVFLPFDTINAAFDYIQSHKALSDDPKDEELYLKILAKHVLENLLPDEELRSELVTSFVNSLIGDLLLKIIIDKLSQPYQIFEIITKVCQSILQEEPETPTMEAKPNQATQSSFADRIYKTFSTVSHFVAHSTSVNSTDKENSMTLLIPCLHIFSFLNNFFQIFIHRPVLYSTIASSNLILNNTKVNHFLTNFISNTFIKLMSSERLMARVLESARGNLFPEDDQMGPARKEPDLEEYEQIRYTTKSYLKKVLLKYKLFTKIIICTDLEWELDNSIEDFLTSLESKRLNKHLVFRLLDLIVSRLFPELSGEAN